MPRSVESVQYLDSRRHVYRISSKTRSAQLYQICKGKSFDIFELVRQYCLVLIIVNEFILFLH